MTPDPSTLPRRPASPTRRLRRMERTPKAGASKPRVRRDRRSPRSRLRITVPRSGSGGQSWTNTTDCLDDYITMSTCNAAPGCLWSAATGACTSGACWNQSTQALCSVLSSYCAWSTVTGTCIPSACSGLGSVACAAASGCSWISSLSVCAGSEGFLHDYGAGTNQYPPNCAMDVRQDTVVTQCVGAANCTITARQRRGDSEDAMGVPRAPRPFLSARSRMGADLRTPTRQTRVRPIKRTWSSK